MKNMLQQRIGKTGIAFRGYNVTNLGRTPELLAHPAYGAVVERHLKELSEICADTIKRKVHLVRRVRTRREGTLRSYAQNLALIVAVELAQIELLEQFFGVSYRDAELACGYSLGEVSALVCGGVYEVGAVLPPLLALAKDASELARNVSMGVLFSRGPALDFAAVKLLCQQITNRGHGTIAISSYLSPNTGLLLGQGGTVDRFAKTMHDSLPAPVHLRKNPHHWPPMHTPICWQRNIPNRAGVMLGTIPGGFTAPTPRVLSGVTGDFSYEAANSRELLCRWVDQPQRVWDVLDKTLASGVETILHVGPEPNIMPATFKRLSIDVSSQLSGRSLTSMGLRAVSRIVRSRPWLTSLMSSDATLLRAPFIEHIMLEDWLLEQELP